MASQDLAPLWGPVPLNLRAQPNLFPLLSRQVSSFNLEIRRLPVRQTAGRPGTSDHAVYGVSTRAIRAHLDRQVAQTSQNSRLKPVAVTVVTKQAESNGPGVWFRPSV